MSLIREFMLILLLTSITGSLLMLVWLTVVHANMGKRNVHYVWWMLKGVLAGYLLPLVYLLFHWCSERNRNSYDILSVSNAKMDQVFFLLFVIWIMGMFGMLLSQLRTWISLRRIQRSSIPAPVEYVQMMQKLATEMNLRKKISLYQGYGVVSPFVFGVSCPKIYLPVQDFSGEELEMILYHELTHYRQGDTFWKLLFGFLGNIYWFSPLSRYLWREAVRWAEVSCDAYCCQEKFQIREYFLLLMKMGSNDQNRLNGYVPMWTEGNRELEWRIMYMKKNCRNRPHRIVITTIIMAFLLGGGVTAHATAQGVRLVYYEVYENTVEEREIPSGEGKKLKGYEDFVKNYAEMQIIKQEDTNSQEATGGILNWTVDHNAMRCTAGFQVKVGRKIRIEFDLEPGDRTVKAGIMKPDGKISYVSGNHSLSHTFRVAMTGTYKVFVSNSSGKAVTVRGSYVIPGYSLISGGYTSQVSGEFQGATEDDPAKMVIKNSCEQNQMDVTYTATADSDDKSVKVEICTDSNFSNVIATATFNRTQPYSATFLLPANQTYYAKITPIGTQSVSGYFTAEY